MCGRRFKQGIFVLENRQEFKLFDCAARQNTSLDLIKTSSSSVVYRESFHFTFAARC